MKGGRTGGPAPGYLSEMRKLEIEEPFRRAVEMHRVLGCSLQWVRDAVGTPNLLQSSLGGTVHTNHALGQALMDALSFPMMESISRKVLSSTPITATSWVKKAVTG